MYDCEDVEEDGENYEETPSIFEIEDFITRVILKMKLSNEVCLISLIFLERLMVIFTIHFKLSYRKRKGYSW